MKNFRKARAVALSLLLAVSAQATEPVPSGFGSSLPELLNWAENNSPMVNAMRFEAQARQQQVTMAGALEDPMFKVEWMDIDKNRPTLAPNEVGAMQYTLTQPLPLWGKRDLKAQAAQASADAAGNTVVSTRAQLRAEIRQAYAQWYRALASLRINREQAALLRQMEMSASQRYAVGKAMQSEALRLQMELSMLANEALGLQNSVEQSRAALAAWLNVAPSELKGAPQQLPAPVPGKDASTWLDEARARNPELAAVRKEIEAARARLDLARLNSRPGLNVGVSGKQMGNKLTNYGLMLEFQIPLQQGAKNAEQSEALAMLMKAQADEQNRLRMIERDVQQMNAMAGTAQRQLELLDKTLLPQAELTLQSALAGYAAGRSEFSMLLEAQQQIRRLRQMRLMAEVDTFTAASGLQKMMGDQ
ncbi:Outer membrane protein TolC [Formivibrio citricus]|uniref:Outer membrane protein TolC n=1 Tax=Formivibrio citricus TaxID=83765 RepID=A0A1I4V4E6_9NEIS|nr:TolC family protein [Formivibrio citricus]SFM96097.1 Outer membrane protein TolC [Formivibrio citricus]